MPKVSTVARQLWLSVVASASGSSSLTYVAADESSYRSSRCALALYKMLSQLNAGVGPTTTVVDFHAN